MNSLVSTAQNILINGRDFLYNGVNFAANLRNVQVWTTLQNLKNYEYLGKIKEIFKCFSSGKSCLHLMNPLNWNGFSKDDEVRTIQELENTAQIFLGLRLLFYVPMLLTPINLRWGNVLLDIASLAGSFFMFQKEIISLNRLQKVDVANDETRITRNSNSWVNRARHMAFITSYATGVISMGLDLLHRFKWTAKIIGFTGSMGTVCSVASLVLLIAGTTFQIIANREYYKQNYVNPCLSRIKSFTVKILKPFSLPILN